MGFEEDDIVVYADIWGLKRLFSLAVRRRGAPRRKRDPVVDQLFEVLERHWGGCWKPSRKRQALQEEDEDYVDAGNLSDCEDAEGLEVSFRHATTDEYMTDDAALSAEPSSSAKESVEGPKIEDDGSAKLATVEGHKLDETAADADDDLENLDGLELDLEEQLLLDQLAAMRTFGGGV